MNKKWDLNKIIKDSIEAGDNCILWKGSTSNGYPNITTNGITILLHKFLFEKISGEKIKKPLTVDHKCRIKLCYSFQHLRKASYSLQNHNRNHYMRTKKLHCKNGHVQNGENTKLRSNGQRRCKLCDDLRNLCR